MSRAQREKGKRGELEVRDIFRDAGFSCDRTPNSGGLQIPGDLTGLEGYHVEVKRQERLRLEEWIAQAEEDCPCDCVPIVAWKKNRGPWRADVSLLWLVNVLALLDHHERKDG